MAPGDGAAHGSPLFGDIVTAHFCDPRQLILFSLHLERLLPCVLLSHGSTFLALPLVRFLEKSAADLLLPWVLKPSWRAALTSVTITRRLLGEPSLYKLLADSRLLLEQN